MLPLNRKKEKKHKICTVHYNKYSYETVEVNYNSSKNNNGSVSQGLGSLIGQPY